MTEDYFYVDRTSHIREIEEYGKSLLFLRPRRFGKSLLLSTLENYYDVNKAEEFERLFGHLAIGQNPTPKHNQYLVMRWDLSEVNTIGSIEQIKQSLYNQLNKQIHNFAVRYQDILGEVEINRDDAISSFASALIPVQRTPYRVHLLIDDYDYLAKQVLMDGPVVSRERYETLLKAESLFKTVLNAVKSATSGFGLDRTFITGVFPIAMSGITSGYNISEDISLDPEFQDCCGFREAEIKETLQKIVEGCDLPEETANEALTMMRTFYNGYAFSHLFGVSAEIYNPTLALYFLDHFQRHCRPPSKMLDGNFALDQAEIAYAASLPGGERLITAALQEKKPIGIYQLKKRLGVSDILNKDQGANFFVSLLYHFGLLTWSKRDEFARLILKIPNLAVRKLYVEQLQKSLLPQTRG